MLVARAENSIRIAAMIGIGDTAIPTARGRTSPITAPIVGPGYQGVTIAKLGSGSSVKPTIMAKVFGSPSNLTPSGLPPASMPRS